MAWTTPATITTGDIVSTDTWNGWIDSIDHLGGLTFAAALGTALTQTMADYYGGQVGDALDARMVYQFWPYTGANGTVTYGYNEGIPYVTGTAGTANMVVSVPYGKYRIEALYRGTINSSITAGTGTISSASWALANLGTATLSGGGTLYMVLSNSGKFGAITLTRTT